MATSNATPEDTPGKPDSARPGAAKTAASTGPVCHDDGRDPTTTAIAAIIDPLIENEKVIAAGFAERARLLAELHRLGEQPAIISGLRGDPVETGADDPDTHAHGPA